MANLRRIILLSVVLAFTALTSVALAQTTRICNESSMHFNHISERCESTWFGFSIGSRNFNYSGTGVTIGAIHMFGEDVHGRIDADYYSLGGAFEIGASLQTNMLTMRTSNLNSPLDSYTNTYIAAGPRGLFTNAGASTIGLGGLIGFEWRIQQVGTFMEMDIAAPLLLVDPPDGENVTAALFKISLGMNMYF